MLAELRGLELLLELTLKPLNHPKLRSQANDRLTSLQHLLSTSPSPSSLTLYTNRTTVSQVA